MKKEQKNQEKGLQALNDVQLRSIKGGGEEGEDTVALVVDNGGMMKT